MTRIIPCPACDGSGTVTTGTENRFKERCIRGHEFNSANTYVRPNGHRECRTCRADAKRVRRGTRTIRISQTASNGVNTGGAL